MVKKRSREYEKIYRSVTASQSLKNVKPIRIDMFVSLLLCLRNLSGGGDQWTGCCPAHADSSPSLSVALKPDGTLLMNCFAGCNFDDICTAVGLSPADMFGSSYSPGPQMPIAHRGRRKTSDDKADPKWQQLKQEYCNQISPEQINQLADQLRLTPESLTRLEVGWSAHDQAWTFPEYNASFEVCGILRRYPDGQKTVMSGSKRGLCLPLGWADDKGVIYVCEGQSDTAAAIMCGHRAIGRPGKNAGISKLADVLRNRPEDITIVLDNDPQSSISTPPCITKTLANLLGRSISIFQPPTPYKDLREFLTRSRQ